MRPAAFLPWSPHISDRPWTTTPSSNATDIDENQRLSEQATFMAFLQKLCDLDDTGKRIDTLVWNEFSGSIRALLDNPYVFQSFWDSRSGKISEADWQTRFAHGKQIARKALASGNTPLRWAWSSTASTPCVTS